MNATNNPNPEPTGPEATGYTVRSPSSSPAGVRAMVQPMGARGSSSSPSRSSGTPFFWPARMPLSLEQVVFLTLAVLMFTTAVVALQVVLVATILISKLL
jgi:hypothetical protein